MLHLVEVGEQVLLGVVAVAAAVTVLEAVLSILHRDARRVELRLWLRVNAAVAAALLPVELRILA